MGKVLQGVVMQPRAEWFEEWLDQKRAVKLSPWTPRTYAHELRRLGLDLRSVGGEELQQRLLAWAKSHSS